MPRSPSESICGVLEDHLRDEPREYWKDAAAERPSNGTLRQLTGE